MHMLTCLQDPDASTKECYEDELLTIIIQYHPNVEFRLPPDCY
jgi:hypothetical protein